MNNWTSPRPSMIDLGKKIKSCPSRGMRRRRRHHEHDPRYESPQKARC